MRMRNLLTDGQQEKLQSINKTDKPKQHNKKNERLSERDLKELMGMNRDLYTRHNGAMRRK